MRSSDGSSDVCASDLELVDDGDLTPYQPTDGFVYTRNDGTEFTIDAAGDVEKIVDPNGNTITITDDGIIHSAGASVEFERDALGRIVKSEEHTSELQSLMRISYAVFCLNKKTHNNHPLYKRQSTTCK